VPCCVMGWTVSWLLSHSSANCPPIFLSQDLAPPPAAGSSGDCDGQRAVVASSDHGGVGRADSG